MSSLFSPFIGLSLPLTLVVKAKVGQMAVDMARIEVDKGGCDGGGWSCRRRNEEGDICTSELDGYMRRQGGRSWLVVVRSKERL